MRRRDRKKKYKKKRNCLICGIEICYPQKKFCLNCTNVAYPRKTKGYLFTRTHRKKHCQVCGVEIEHPRFKYCKDCSALAVRKNACESSKIRARKMKAHWETLTDDEQLKRMKEVCEDEFKKLDLKEILLGEVKDTKLHRRTIERRIARRRREIEELEKMHDKDLLKVEKLYKKINRLKRIRARS